jgi:enoyl-CoA hydratase/carnithine racemase
VVGPAKAKEMIYLGEMINAAAALEIGLVNRVVPPDKLMEEAHAVAGKLAALSTPVLAMAKMAINTAVETDLASGLSMETRCNALCFALEDRQEGMDAFMEKRKAVFKNK